VTEADLKEHLDAAEERPEKVCCHSAGRAGENAAQ
jgi:hypothetical protein